MVGGKMKLFYRPKHMKKKYNLPFDKFHAVMNFIIEETVWYITWWFELIANIFQKLHQFGEWILESTAKLIDLNDRFLDWFEDQFK